MKKVLTNCNLINGVSDSPMARATVVIENGRISEVLADQKNVDGREAISIDCRGGWLMPGLWDVHAHLGYPGPIPDSLPNRTIQYGMNAADALVDSGITSLRTVGTDNWIDVAWKRAFAAGEFLGPRIFAGGHFLTTTGGHALSWPYTKECDGAIGFVSAIREEIKHGVDHVKLNLTGGIMGHPWDNHRHNFLLTEELEPAFRLCQQREIKVVSHATNPQAVKDAIRLGCWSIEHGYIMDEKCIQMMLDYGTFYVPTLSITHLTPRQATNEWERRYVEFRNRPDEFMARADAAAKEHQHWFQLALSSGVKMAIGSDLGPLKEGALLEMGIWVRDGATPMQAIRAATKTAAEACDAGDELGSIEVGKIADVIVVKDSPLDDINNIRTLQMVFKEGDLVMDRRDSLA